MTDKALYGLCATQCHKEIRGIFNGGILFTFFSQWGRCDRSELKTRSDDRKREPEVTVTMAAATGSGSTGGPWGRDLRTVPEIGFGDVARVVEQNSQAPKTSLSKGYKFFADSFVHDVEGKLNTSPCMNVDLASGDSLSTSQISFVCVCFTVSEFPYVPHAYVLGVRQIVL